MGNFFDKLAELFGSERKNGAATGSPQPDQPPQGNGNPGGATGHPGARTRSPDMQWPVSDPGTVSAVFHAGEVISQSGDEQRLLIRVLCDGHGRGCIELVAFDPGIVERVDASGRITRRTGKWKDVVIHLGRDGLAEFREALERMDVAIEDLERGVTARGQVFELAAPTVR